MYNFLCEMFLFFLGTELEMEFLAQIVTLVFNSLKSVKLLSIVAMLF